MQWIVDNWVWIVVFIAFVALHLFGHGGHGGHGGDGEEEAPRRRRDDGEPGRSSGHRH
ncbi:hypothetical protein SVA_3232 [Sulfurifustis variabilis]|uniref:DUF2933 domain-containing protein n=1 Tax=Sulfurifustis variabilis TaxID=1675686 RepID=A0A1C7AEZ7_9GAMM|nr:DUF2933 domain-containing protein [Sulfurifustis variabilis]BAU49780.1 hypothetical protein SVA_3232 [Sulfurifustis variabilis]